MPLSRTCIIHTIATHCQYFIHSFVIFISTFFIFRSLFVTKKTFFNSSDENNVCFTYNCTHAINIVLNGVLNSGDHIIISSLEHNAVFRPVNYLKINKGIEFDVAEVDLLDDEITLKNIEKLFKKNTKMVFLTAASNVIGKKLPLKEIGELCKDNNILFGVDAAQAAGIIKIDMKKLNINFLCFAPHKGFYAPTGLGVLITEKYLNKIGA